MKTKIIIFIGTVFLLIKCSPKKEIIHFSDRIDSLLKKELVTDGPGGVVLIMRGDSVVYSKGYGLADLNTKAPITTKTLFNLGRSPKHLSRMVFSFCSSKASSQ